MPDLLQKAVTAKRESKYIEFKAMFDPSSAGDWCEITKDIVALANSGGGIIIFGMDSLGKPTGADLSTLASIDPADVGNKISKYIGSQSFEVEVREVQKDGVTLQAFVVKAASIPVIFQKPGSYEIGHGKQRTAFSVGTIYFRHGAKSEPGNSDDIRAVIERRLEVIRKSWLKGVRKLVQAPPGSQLISLASPDSLNASSISSNVRSVRSPTAIPVFLTRDTEKAVGSFMHEEVSEGIFDEINNVIDANRVLARGQRRFFFGKPVYYRIYAERQHVRQSEDGIGLLLHSAMCDMYAPALYWSLKVSEQEFARAFADLYLRPKSPQVHTLIRMAVLLDESFCGWLADRWQKKWRRYAQKPSFVLTFDEMRSNLKTVDPRLLAARLGATSQLEIEGNSVSVANLLNDAKQARSLLSDVCVRVFDRADSSMASIARDLDYISYGLQVCDKAKVIGRSIIKTIGDQEPGDTEIRV